MREFYKYHGAGNDFIIVDNRDKEFDVKKVKSLCDRHFGVGADGLILVESSDKADCFMNYYNADGTVAEMCGNGVRCTARFFFDHIKAGVKEVSIDTRAGIKKVVCNNDGTFSVNMGAPVFSHVDFPKSSMTLENIVLEFVSMGNPHAVGMVKNLNEVDISQIGPKIENDPHFPNKINLELVEKVSDTHFKVKVWERGSGATLACGTGACAVYSIVRQGLTTHKSKHPIGKAYGVKEITLEFPGGNLYLSENEKGEIILRGEATFVFKGEMNASK